MVAFDRIVPLGACMVELSARDIHVSLIPDVKRILLDTGFAPEGLVLEITESVLMCDLDFLTMGRLRELKELGVSIAIDDFGTDYSSLAYLHQLPIDILKIDKSFVGAASTRDAGGDASMRTILRLSRGRDLKSIAMGIEHESQALHVDKLGCQSAQVYLFSQPIPPSELDAFFAGHAVGKYPMASSL
jgi:EAL domain-containing protein (putative c-di-GMP-specific phosphodiesterase class I)